MARVAIYSTKIEALQKDGGGMRRHTALRPIASPSGAIKVPPCLWRVPVCSLRGACLFFYQRIHNRPRNLLVCGRQLGVIRKERIGVRASCGDGISSAQQVIRGHLQNVGQ